MQNLKLIDLNSLDDYQVKVHKNKKYQDTRGELNLLFEYQSFKNSVVSMKESFTFAGFGRGLHYQNLEFPQTKIIRVTQGKILDLLYDPTSNNATVYGFYLSQNDCVTIEIPPYYAHGFIALEDVKFNYACIGEYREDKEVTFNMIESIAKILNLGDVIISNKDKASKQIFISNII